MLSPRPSSRAAPSIWRAAVAAPQPKSAGKRLGVVVAVGSIEFATLLNRSRRSYVVYRPLQAGGGKLSEPRRDRVTIRDIAERAGVSKVAVSYALNGQPGVSAATREKIVSIADELGWYPNRAARALSAARADACGLVLARPARTLALEPFFMEFIAGVESELARQSMALTIQLVRDIHEEVAVYRRWWGEHRVDGVLMVDPRIEDARVGELVKLGLPAVVVGGPLGVAALPRVWNDETAVVTGADPYLAALGHERIAQVAGVGDFVHTRQRTAAFREAADALGLRWEIQETDYSAEYGARVTRTLLSSPDAPTAIVFDSDLLAVTGLSVAQRMGFAIPDDLSIVGWDDSLISQVVHPPLTAITRDIQAFGVTAARHLLAAVNGEAASDIETVRGELTTRGSTGRPVAVR
jgi:DNA-binding LacI/PurR family transcriptional regulator